MKFGVRVGMLKTTFEEAHEEAGKLGFDGVELEVGPNTPDEGTPLFDVKGRKALMERMKACGVATSCVCIGGFWKYSPAEADKALRDTGLDLLKKTIQACAEIGAECILTPLNNSGEEPDIAVGRWLEFLQEAKPVAEEHKITVALEPCARPGLGTPEEVMALVDKADSPYIRVYLDVANNRVAGSDSVEAIKTLGTKYLAHIHMKDLKENPPDSERPFSVVGLGEGMLDFPTICKTIVEVGYDGWLTLETPAVDDAKESAKKNLDILKAYF
ncbi:MAG: sugar phosphate isomerase/epimerase [Planctomycetes bacterium]|nr:sugar phosphate isomerase/epimerase [Planctomycetota bacterium]